MDDAKLTHRKRCLSTVLSTVGTVSFVGVVQNDDRKVFRKKVGDATITTSFRCESA